MMGSVGECLYAILIGREKRNNMIIGVTGCLAQEVREEFIKRTPFVDLVIGNQNIAKLPDIIEKIQKGTVDHIVDRKSVV